MPPTNRPPIRGDITRALRLARGLTLLRVAEDTGVSIGTLSRVESGERTPSRRLVLALAASLDVPVTVLSGQQSPITALREALGISADELAAAVDADSWRLTAPGELDAELAERIADRLGVPASVLAVADQDAA